MKLFRIGLVLACGLGVIASTKAAEVLHYTLVRGSTITPYDGGSPIGPTEPLSGRLDWVLYPYPITGTIIAFDSVTLDFRSPSFSLQLNRTTANDIMSAVHLDSNMTVFDEVADLTGLAASPGSLMSLSPGSYLGPPTRPVVLNYPNVGIGPVGGGAWLARLELIMVMEGMVNVAPSFTKGPDLRVLQNAGPQTVTNWATNISPGPTNEAWQTVTFILTNNNNALFSVPPAITPDGALTFTPARNRNGLTLVSVVLRDNGGTLYGGEDTSPPQTFRIAVLSPCEAVQELALSVQQADLGHFNKRPLLASLDHACLSFERGSWNTGISHLRAFQHLVLVHLARTYPELAHEWITEAQDIVDMFANTPNRPQEATARAIPAPEL